jgi:hypothetical protein
MEQFIRAKLQMCLSWKATVDANAGTYLWSLESRCGHWQNRSISMGTKLVERLASAIAFAAREQHLRQKFYSDLTGFNGPHKLGPINW